MYIVTLDNNGKKTVIHNEREKVAMGSVVKGINSIDSFSFSLLPSNVGFGLLHEFSTLVNVYNREKDRHEFYGRVLYSNPSMDDNGLIQEEVTCESYFGFFCDSQQEWVREQNWTVRGLLEHLVNTHNAQVEEYKRFRIGEVTVTDPNDNVYCGIQRENTWDALKSKLLDVLGGELQFRVEDGVLWLDYLTAIGGAKETPIAMSRNMKSITKEKDPSAYITRLIPLGCKVNDDDADDETRLTVESVNGGLNYIDDAEAIAQYGIHAGYHEWDDITTPEALLSTAKKWLKENNKVMIKYSITALDLSLLGLDIDDFDVGNTHPVINPLLGIDDVARIAKKNINICEDYKSTIEVGESFKTLSDLQLEQKNELKTVKKSSSSISKLKQEVSGVHGNVSKLEGALSALSGQVHMDGYVHVIVEAMPTANGLDVASFALPENVSEYWIETAWLDCAGVRRMFPAHSCQASLSDASTLTINSAEDLSANTGHFIVAYKF